jgi:hypothetical protein
MASASRSSTFSLAESVSAPWLRPAERFALEFAGAFGRRPSLLEGGFVISPAASNRSNEYNQQSISNSR